MLGASFAWTWTALAGGGGLLLLIQKGPWPLTNGWFAMLSGLCACPATAWVLRRYAGLRRAWVMPLAAAALFVLGRLTLALSSGTD